MFTDAISLVAVQEHLQNFNHLSFLSQHPCQDSLWGHLQDHHWVVSPTFQVLRLIKVHSLWSLLLLFQCPLLLLNRSSKQKFSVSSTAGRRRQQLLWQTAVLRPPRALQAALPTRTLLTWLVGSPDQHR